MAASVTTSSAAISRIVAGITTGPPDASGRQRAASTSRSRRVSSGMGRDAGAVGSIACCPSRPNLTGRQGESHPRGHSEPSRAARTVSPTPRDNGGGSHKEQTMQHVRIATYQQTAGTFEELSRMIQAPGGLADVFRATPGFVAYTFADLGDGTNCSISVWGS